MSSRRCRGFFRVVVFALFSIASVRASFADAPLPDFADAPSMPSLDSYEMPSHVPQLMKVTAQIMPNIKDWNLKESGASKNPLALTWPVRGVVSSGFGPRGMGPGGRWIMHEGLDIPVPSGTPVQAAMDGVVAEARVYNGYGNTVIVSHANGVRTLYAHCSEILVKKGQEVESGQMIAYSGNTGRSTTPHVHFGVMSAGAFCDPTTFLKYPAQHFVYRKSAGRN
ncbi:hypothetical protein FACS1894204_09630 [Synergistales bacterium]|nr:hypothetical protein FACS1894204_09630 [Synergistales bacterium]